jgi:N-acetyl sugar amidotransferase
MPNMIEYQICEVCVMDTSDPDIVFSGEDGCNHCITSKLVLKSKINLEIENNLELNRTINLIKQSKKKKGYNCILGLSGGTDSSFLAIKCFDFGLKPLLLHVDTGWNSEIAVKNIQSVLDYTGWTLHTEVIDWNVMRELQLAYFRSGISNQDVPQDHAIFSTLYRYAKKYNIKFVLNGGNSATEGIFPLNWHSAAMDSINLKNIYQSVNKSKLKNYPTTTFTRYYFYYPFIKRLKSIRLLNLIDYNKKSAIMELQSKTGWKPYPQKHGESNFTKFFQNYYLISRFGIDKRRAHLSSEIVSGQISRDFALSELAKAPYDTRNLSRDVDYICRKLGISKVEWENLVSLPIRNYRDFKNWDTYYAIMKRTQTFIEKTFNYKMRKYS